MEKKDKKIYVISVGIELEGGLDDLEFNKLLEMYEKDGKFSHGTDGSVYVPERQWNNLELKYYSESLEELFKFIEVVFSLGFKQNHTCGNHIHLKFNNQELALALLSFKPVQESFFKAYKEKFKDNEKYISRCYNKYCKMIYDKNSVLNQLYYRYKTDRYYAINLNSFNVHGTIEIRILPHFSSFEEAKESILFIVTTIEEILNKFLEEHNEVLDAETIEIKELIKNVNIDEKQEIIVNDLQFSTIEIFVF